MVIFLWGKFGKEGAKCMLGIKLEHSTFSQMLFASARHSHDNVMPVNALLWGNQRRRNICCI